MLKININLLFSKTKMILIRKLTSRASRKFLETEEKVVKAAIIGMPNVGKSTLINAMMNLRVCAASDKVHTTTTHAQAIRNRNSSQIIVFDTPGLVTKKEIKHHKLSSDFVSSCRHSIQNSSIVGVVHDVSNHWTRGNLHPMILNLLKEYSKTPSFLILNKIDKLKSKRAVLELIKTLTCNNLALEDSKKSSDQNANDASNATEKTNEGGWPHFKSVFMVSSTSGDGVEKVVDFLEAQATLQSWEYKNNETTDQTPAQVIEQSVRARLLDYLPQEIPYLLKPQLEYFSDENNKVFASVIVLCPHKRHEMLLCGVGDGKLRQITDRVTSDLIQIFQMPVSLTLTTTVLPTKNE